MRTLENLDPAQLELVTGGVNRTGFQIDDARANAIAGATLGNDARPGTALAGFQFGLGDTYRPGFADSIGAPPIDATEGPSFGLDAGAIPELDLGAALPDFTELAPELDAAVGSLLQGDFGAALSTGFAAAASALDSTLAELGIEEPDWDGTTESPSQEVGMVVCGTVEANDLQSASVLDAAVSADTAKFY